MTMLSAGNQILKEQEPPVMTGPVIASTLFHVLLIGATAIGMPYVMKEPLMISTPVSVEIVDISELTQTDRVAPPQKVEKEKPPEPEPMSRPEPPKMTAEAPPDLTVPVPPDLKEETEPPKEAAPPPEPVVKKPEKKPPEPKKPPERKVQARKPENDFQSLLKNLTPDAAAQSEKNDSKIDSQPTQRTQIASLADRLTMSEEDALKRQLGQCWNVPIGGRYAEELVVEVRVVMNPDRTVRDAGILDRGRYNRDSHFRAAADAALRALRNPRCSPLKLPPEKYEQWKTIVINFDPREML